MNGEMKSAKSWSTKPMAGAALGRKSPIASPVQDMRINARAMSAPEKRPWKADSLLA
jgi:hypothetical protein